MKKIIQRVLVAGCVTVLVSACSVLTVQAQRSTTSNEPLSERRVAYTMDVALDPDAKTIRGTERLTWTNPGNVPIDELRFHMYLNAFKNERSTFMKESGGVHRGFTAGGNTPWGSVQIDRIQVLADPDSDLRPPVPGGVGTDLTENMRFVQPDDGNIDDETVMALSLPFAVQPGESITLDIEFESVLPEIFSRTGWAETDSGNPFFMVAQWFPKIAVYEIPGQRYVPEDAEAGEWNAHQFHANSEFYADYGTYDVSITVPETYSVGATGVRAEESRDSGFKTIQYLADDVHDFAWTASPDFLVFEDTWEHVSLRLLLQPAHKKQAQRHFDAAKVALRYYAEWVGEYPYTTLTLVDGIGGSNGMEYPTLITCGTIYNLPEWARPLEMVTIHEFGHQYFYGLIGSNEFEEAWLDEGVNSYIESRLLDEEYGPGSLIDFAGLQAADTDMQRVVYTKNSPSRGALLTNTWEYQFGDYSKASYMKPATVLHTLERYLGWETMQNFLKTYYETWRFRHPSTKDFQAVAEEVSGQDLDWFFEQFVVGTATFDYKLHSIMLGREFSEDGSVRYGNRVLVEKAGDGYFPQTILATFADGSTETQEFAGKETWTALYFPNEAPLVEIYIDPDNAVLLDTNRLNNRRVVRTEADNSFARTVQLRLTSFLQQFVIALTGIF